MSSRPGVASVRRVRGHRRDRVRPHAVPAELHRADLRERRDTGLGRAVVGLARVADQTRRRRRVHDRCLDLFAGFRLLAPVRGRVTGRAEMTLQVHRDDGVPLQLGHVDEHAVAQDARVVHEHVEVAERLDRLVDEPLRTVPVRDAVDVGDGLAAHRDDLVGHLLGGRAVGALAVGVPAEVVDDHLGALGGEEQRVLAAEPASGPGDDRHATVQRAHAPSPFPAFEPAASYARKRSRSRGATEKSRQRRRRKRHSTRSLQIEGDGVAAFGLVARGGCLGFDLAARGCSWAPRPGSRRPGAAASPPRPSCRRRSARGCARVPC